MTTTTAPTARIQSGPSALGVLTRIEAGRYARHPVFLVGFALALLAGTGVSGPIELDHQVIPAFFIGVLGIVVAARLTTSTDGVTPVMSASPVAETTRTAALCLACLVPAAAGLITVLAHRVYLMSNPLPDYQYGTYASLDRLLITIVIPVIACAGGPLLGVVVGRWLRFPGAALAVVVVLLAWVTVTAYLPEQQLESTTPFARLLHFATPYTSFGTGTGQTVSDTIRSYTGSPLGFSVWTLALCALAVCAAMVHGAEGHVRRLLTRWLLVLSSVALVGLVVGGLTGNRQLYDTTENGTVPASSSTPLGG